MASAVPNVLATCVLALIWLTTANVVRWFWWRGKLAVGARVSLAAYDSIPPTKTGRSPTPTRPDALKLKNPTQYGREAPGKPGMRVSAQGREVEELSRGTNHRNLSEERLRSKPHRPARRLFSHKTPSITSPGARHYRSRRCPSLANWDRGSPGLTSDNKHQHMVHAGTKTSNEYQLTYVLRSVRIRFLLYKILFSMAFQRPWKAF